MPAGGVDRTRGAAGGSTPLVSIPGHLIRRAQRVHNVLWAELVPGDLTGPQYAVLAALAAFPQCDQQQVAGLVSLDKSSAADVVARLVRKAWIDRERGYEDRRRYLLSLTPAAAIALSSITPRVSAVQDALLAPIPASRRLSFTRALATVARLPEGALEAGHQAAYPVLELGAPGHLIRCAQQTHTAYWSELLDGQLTGPQYAVLHAISRWPGINQRRAGELAALDKSSTADVVSRLSTKAWIKCERDPDDGRGRILNLTREAMALLADVQPKVELVQQRLLEALRPEERTRFVNDLARVAFAGKPPEAAT